MTEQWITVKDACERLGLSRAKFMDLTVELDPFRGAPYITTRRPSPCVIWVLLDDVIAHDLATRDPEFWSLRKSFQRLTPADQKRQLPNFRALG